MKLYENVVTYKIYVTLATAKRYVACILTADAKKYDESAAENTGTADKNEKKNLIKDLATKYQQSTWAQRYSLQIQIQFKIV